MNFMINDKPNCSRHSKEILGISDMKSLAEMVGDLHYATLTVFLSELSNKIRSDGEKDFRSGREKLASELLCLSISLGQSALHSGRVWQICKPFMNENS